MSAEFGDNLVSQRRAVKNIDMNKLDSHRGGVVRKKTTPDPM